MSNSGHPISRAAAAIAGVSILALLIGASPALAGEEAVTVRKTGPQLTLVGDTATFTIQIENVGGTVISGSGGAILKMTDVMPVNFGWPYSIQAGPDWKCASSIYVQQVACQYVGPPVVPGQPFPPISISAKGITQGQYNNCAKAFFADKGKLPPDAAAACAPGVVRISGETSLCALRTRSVAPGKVMAYDKKVPFRITVEGIGNTACETARFITGITYLDDGQIVAINLSDKLLTGLQTGGDAWVSGGMQVPTDDIVRSPNTPLAAPHTYGGAFIPSSDGITSAQDGFLICTVAVVNISDYQAILQNLASIIQDTKSKAKSGVARPFSAWANRINNALEIISQSNAACSGVQLK